MAPGPHGESQLMSIFEKIKIQDNQRIKRGSADKPARNFESQMGRSSDQDRQQNEKGSADKPARILASDWTARLHLKASLQVTLSRQLERPSDHNIKESKRFLQTRLQGSCCNNWNDHPIIRSYDQRMIQERGWLTRSVGRSTNRLAKIPRAETRGRRQWR